MYKKVFELIGQITEKLYGQSDSDYKSAIGSLFQEFSASYLDKDGRIYWEKILNLNVASPPTLKLIQHNSS